ncbi:winged helix-turn-helix domain-containing protein, partial [Acinetobacter baumannii]
RQNAEQHRAKIADAVQKAATEEASLHAQRIRETKNEHYAISQNIAKLVWQEVLTAKKNNQPLATAAPNLKALDIAITALAKARMERWSVLGLDRPDAVDTNELATLEITELTADEIEELRERNFNEFEIEGTEPVQETVEVKSS